MGASVRRNLNFTAVAGVVVGLLFLAAAYWPGRPALAGARAAKSVVTISIRGPSTKLPRSFFGFSVEYPELPIYQRFRPAFERILALLKVQADGPQILRIGGNSADLTYWNPASSPLPGGAYVLSQDWFSQLRTLIADSRLRLLLDLNLRNGTAAQARELAQQAVSKLPAGSVIGLEVGNEPDQYGHGYSSAAYVRAFKSYDHAVREVAPHMPLLGPAVTSTDNNFSWLQAVVRGDHAELGVLDGHEYPLAACESPGDPGYPTVAKILSSRLTAGLAASVKPAVLLAHRAHRAFRLDETNSVTCGGLAGVSDTFSTALWAPDALFSLLTTGLDAVNVHIRPTKVNGPLAVNGNGFVARPLFYGLLLFRETLSPGGQLLHLNQSGPASAHLSAWAVRVNTRAIHLLLINKGNSAVTARLRLPPSSTVTLERMRASSARATSGVTLGGQHLGSDGRLHGTSQISPLPVRAGSYQVLVPATSAALVIAQQ